MSSVKSKNSRLTVESSGLVDLSQREMPSRPAAVVDLNASIFYALASMNQQNVDVAIVLNGSIIIGLLSLKDLIPLVAKQAMEVEADYDRLKSWFDLGQTFMNEATSSAVNILEQVEALSASQSPAIKSYISNAKVLIAEIPMLMDMPDVKMVKKVEMDTGVFLNELVGVLRHSASPKGVRLVLGPLDPVTFVADSGPLCQAAKHIIEDSIRTATAGSVINIECKQMSSSLAGLSSENVMIQVTLISSNSAESAKDSSVAFKSIGHDLIETLLKGLNDSHENCRFRSSGSSKDVILEMTFPIATSASKKLAKFQSIKVLVVEDDPDILQLMSETLSNHGFVVITAVNGEEGLAQFHAHRPSLVLTDIYMPILDGIKLTEEIKKIAPSTKIVIFSGRYTSLLEDCSDGILKCDHVLYKPFAQKDVLETVLLIV